ncbi:pirin family protein [Pelomonas sp. SE-A7]|uniref:pirin family protein n=1 Tax=Pelomonas sp. SE-A7 TaxID=3054953 RepID=UPI00259CB5C7|nr:pirin family protein [Pelomonas sp. SE-A7]MDM4767874.1 pirin family protein [Pelomonas sp. SE-A7]
MAQLELLDAHQSQVGGLPIRRALPHPGRRRVGAWCFLDHAGPAHLHPPGMRVGPHPHTGLQTFSWLIEGEILHRDSLGSEQVLRPGQVNLMTAGRGICHSEESLSDRLQLAQLWIALPESQRHCAPAFEHFPRLPQWSDGGFHLTLLVGSLDSAHEGHQQSPVPSHTPLLGVDLACSAASRLMLPLTRSHEHGLMVLEGELEIQVDGQEERLQPGRLLYVPVGAKQLLIRSEGRARLLLLGGEPLDEQILLWWNFVGRTQDEIRQWSEQWNAGTGPFGAVHGYEGERLLAPDASALKMRAS